MSYAVYNPMTNSIRTWVATPFGGLPDGYEFRPKAIVPDNATLEPADPGPVPEFVPMWAFRRALRKQGLLTQIMDFIKTLPTEDSEDALEHLEYGNFIERNHPLIVTSASQLGMSEATVDDIFRTAALEK